jgi:hypothetical protein
MYPVVPTNWVLETRLLEAAQVDFPICIIYIMYKYIIYILYMYKTWCSMPPYTVFLYTPSGTSRSLCQRALDPLTGHHFCLHQQRFHITTLNIVSLYTPSGASRSLYQHALDPLAGHRSCLGQQGFSHQLRQKGNVPNILI